MIMIEEDARALREKNSLLEETCQRLTQENETFRARHKDLADTAENLEQRIADENEKNRKQMRQEIEAYQHDHEKEIQEKEKKIAELENEKLLIARQNENTVDRLTNELEEVKEQVVYLKRNEAVIEVYKRKLEQMADLKTELNDQQELNQRLQIEIQEM